MTKPGDDPSRKFPPPTPVSRKPRSAGRVLWDGIVITAGIFAAASASFAVILRAGLSSSNAVLAGAVTTGVIALLIGITIALCRAQASRANDKATAAERRLEAFAAASTDAFVILRGDERRTASAVSEPIEALTGYPRESFLDGTVGLADLLDPADARVVPERLAAARERGKAYRIAYGLRQRSGAARRVEETGTETSGGRFPERIAVLRDVTDRSAQPPRNPNVELELRVLRDHSPVGIAYFNERGIIRGLNAAAAAHIGNAIDHSFFSALRPEGNIGWEPAALPALAKASPLALRVAGNPERRLTVWINAAPPGDSARRPSVAFMVAAPVMPASSPEPVPVKEPVAAASPPSVEPAAPVPAPAFPTIPRAPAVPPPVEPVVTVAPEPAPATGFPSLLDAEFRRARRFGGVFGVIVLDVDWETQDGEPVASPDEAHALAAVEDMCREHVREVDVVARRSAASVAVILPEAGSRSARSVAERMRRAIREIVVERDGLLLRPLPAVGATRLRSDDTDPAAVFDRAAHAAERARQRGGNQVVND